MKVHGIMDKVVSPAHQAVHQAIPARQQRFLSSPTKTSKIHQNYVTDDLLRNVFCKFWILLTIKIQYRCKCKRIRCHTWYGNENWRLAQANKSATEWNVEHWTGVARKPSWAPGLSELIYPSGPRVLIRAFRLCVTVLVRGELLCENSWRSYSLFYTVMSVNIYLWTPRAESWIFHSNVSIEHLET